MKQLLIFGLLFIFSLGAVAQNQENINQFDAQGRRHGLWKGTYEKTKRPRYEGTFEHGKEVGVFTYYDDTKKKTIIATRDFSKNDGSCYVTFFEQKGSKVSEGVMKNNQKTGVWKFYHKGSPQIMSIENYNNDLLEGERKVYYKNGKIAGEQFYVNGVKEGIFKSYGENGIVIEEATYKNGKLDGLVIYRDHLGNYISKGNYLNGLKDGEWEFHENGKIASKGVFKESIKKGIWKFYKNGEFFEERDMEAKPEKKDPSKQTKTSNK